MKDALDLQKFYPEEISVTEVIQNEKEIYIHVSVQSKNCTCPKCGVISEHKHGTYKRKLQDLPILGRTTYLIVNAYEYQCDNSSCDVTTFVENVDGFLNYYSRMTEYYGAAEPPVRCGESHLSGLTESLHFVY